MNRIAILTEIPAPFRIPLFNELAQRPGVALDVVFLARSQPGRPYRLHLDELRFPWRVLRGVRGSVGGRWVAANAGVLGTVRRADTVLVGGWNQPAFWQAAAAARLLRRQLVIWVESTPRDARLASGRAERVRRAFVGAADAVVVPGRASSDYVSSLGARRIVVAPNAVDTAIFGTRVDAERSRRDELRRSLGLSGCVFLAVGRLAPEKGFDVLLRAFAAVEDAELVVVGAGQEEARLKALAGPRVRFVGAVDRDTLPRWYAAADCLVAPSTSEPWGFAIQEAAVAGLPIVASDAAGAAWDLVEDGANGFRVRAGDTDALRLALVRIAVAPELRSAAGARSRELAAPLTATAWADAVVALSTLRNESAQ